MILLAAATRHAEYAYYHFLSGSDMCLKSQDEIHRFFDAHSGKLFLTFCGEDWQRTQAQKRARYYYRGGKSSGSASDKQRPRDDAEDRRH